MISIIIPVYNQAKFLGKCVRSLVEQTYKGEIELIIVNDGSTDNTAEVIKGLKSRYRIYDMELEENMGANIARNVGYRVAMGEYLLICDGDMVFYPTYLEKLAKILDDKPEISVAYCNFRTIGMSGARQSNHTKYFKPDDLLKWNFINMASLIRRKDFAGFNPEIERFQDWDEWLTMLEQGKKLFCLDETLFTHDSTGSQITKDGVKSGRRWQDIVATKHLPLLSKEGELPDGEGQSRPLASIIVLSHNLAGITVDCLKSLQEFTYYPHELIVVDNASEKKEIEKVESYLTDEYRGKQKLIKSKENLGFTGGTKKGRESAKGDYTVLINNDILLSPHWLEKMIAVFSRDPAVGIVGCACNGDSCWQGAKSLRNSGRIDQFRHAPDPDLFEGSYLDYAEVLDKKHKGEHVTIEWALAFFCTVFKKEVTDELGWFDEIYRLGLAEDLDYCNRAKEAGYKLAVAIDTYIFHYHRLTWKNMEKKEGFDYMTMMHENQEIYNGRWGEKYGHLPPAIL